MDIYRRNEAGKPVLVAPQVFGMSDEPQPLQRARRTENEVEDRASGARVFGLVLAALGLIVLIILGGVVVNKLSAPQTKIEERSVK